MFGMVCCLRNVKFWLTVWIRHLVRSLVTSVLQGQVHHGVLQCTAHVELQ